MKMKKKKVVQKKSIHTPRENNINNVVKEHFSSEHIHPDIVFTVYHQPGLKLLNKLKSFKK